MARTVAEINDELLAAKAAQPALDVLNSTSNVAIWKLKLYIVAVCFWSIEKLFDILRSEIDEVIATKKPHTPQWYVQKSKDFQYGYDLVPEKDYYDNTGIADDVIAASKVVAYAALVEEPVLRLKVAKLVGQNLAPLSAPELAAFVTYIKRIKGAGVKLRSTTITSTDPDNLRLVLRVKYNALVLNSNGERLDGTALTPVPDAIKKYLYNLDFNGLFSVQKMVDYIQAVDGVEDVRIDEIQTKYGLLPFTAVDIDFVPDSGYLVIDDADLIPTYIPA